MARRTTQQSKTDELAFPVRVKVAVPDYGMGRELDDIRDWLKAELGSDQFAVHPTPGLGGSAAAYYFRTVPAALRFFDAFPGLRLADGTLSPAYKSAVKR
jgi:hypothetical protein